jgi:hypothetical protein
LYLLLRVSPRAKSEIGEELIQIALSRSPVVSASALFSQQLLIVVKVDFLRYREEESHVFTGMHRVPSVAMFVGISS